MNTPRQRDSDGKPRTMFQVFVDDARRDSTADSAPADPTRPANDHGLPGWPKKWPTSLRDIAALLRYALDVLRLPHDHELVVSLITDYEWTCPRELNGTPG